MTIAELYQIYKAHPAVSTDTRQIQPGCIFFALKGEKFDGNVFATKAIEYGAAFAVVSDPSLQGDHFIHVDDTLFSLQQLARYHRDQFKIPVFALTGSNGKTTTKEMVNAVLSCEYNVHATSGNFNNHIGVPLTLLRMHESTELAVIEMGANHPGEIKELCEIAMPTHGLITNIGKAHLEGFGSIEGVAKAKGELFEYLHKHEGTAFINADDERLTAWMDKLSHSVSYSLSKNVNADIQFDFEEDTSKQGFSLRRESVEIHSSLFGKYNAMNMVAAFTVGEHFGVDRSEIISVLSGFKSGANRSEEAEHKGWTIIKDAYNANPSSMELAVRAFDQRYPGQWMILGDMKELGKESLELHQHIVNVVDTLHTEKVFFIGTEFSRTQAKKNDRYVFVPDIESLMKTWQWDNPKTLLIKGSRSMHLEKILEV